MEDNNIAYACINKDKSVRDSSTSGGVYTVFADYILKKEGIVYGVSFDRDFNVVFEDSDHVDYRAFRGSKYPQAKLGDTFKEVKRNLDMGRYVLFTGCPCQVAGLKSFLNKEYDKLVTVDFICMGIGSPYLWQKYLNETCGTEEIRAVRFKDKSKGWHNFSTVIETNRKKYKDIGVENLYMKSYLKRVNIRPSCYECRFKGATGRRSDITISDCWGIDKIMPQIDDNKGISGVYVNTENGAKLFEAVADRLSIYKLSRKDTIACNGYYQRPVELPIEREDFWKDLKSLSFGATVKKYYGEAKHRFDIKSRIIRLLK